MSFDRESAEAAEQRKDRRVRDYKRFLRIQSRFEGARALYREGNGISLVRVGALRPTPDRFHSSIELIPTRGLYNQRPQNWSVSATWDTFGFTIDEWACGYISMTAKFDVAMIDAVVARAIVAEPEEYSRDRKIEIWQWIHEYHRTLLARHRLQSLTLTWQGQPMAQLADHWLSEYPEVNSRVEAESLEPTMRSALDIYGAWWHANDDRERPELPFADSLFIGWKVVTPNGRYFEASIPKFDFRSGRVVWRCGGLMVTDTADG